MTDKVTEAMEAIAPPKTNMTPQKRKIAAMVAVVKESLAYELGQIDYAIKGIGTGDTIMYVWQTRSHDAFYELSLHQTAKHIGLSAWVAVRDNHVTLIVL